MIQLIAIGIAGVLFHCLCKLQSLLKNARAANINFNALNDYWLKDAVAIIISLLSVGIWYSLFGEISTRYPALAGWEKTSYFVMGGMGSYVLQLLLSTAQKRINKVVDVKSNDSDGTDQAVTKLSDLKK